MGSWLLPLAVANVITISHCFYGFPWQFWGEETIFYNDATHWARSGLLQTHTNTNTHSNKRHPLPMSCTLIATHLETSSLLTGTMAHIPPKCVWTWFAGTSSVLQSNSVCLTQLNRSSHCVSRYRITFLAHTSLWGHTWHFQNNNIFPDRLPPHIDNVPLTLEHEVNKFSVRPQDILLFWHDSYDSNPLRVQRR